MLVAFGMLAHGECPGSRWGMHGCLGKCHVHLARQARFVRKSPLRPANASAGHEMRLVQPTERGAFKPARREW